MTRKQMKSFSTGAIVVGLVLLPGLASFIQQQLLQKKMMKLDLAQGAMAQVSAPSSGSDNQGGRFTRLTFDTTATWPVVL